MGHGLGFREGEVLAVRKDGDVTKVRHKGVGFPTEEPHDLDISEAQGVKEDASADPKGMGGPKG